MKHFSGGSIPIAVLLPSITGENNFEIEKSLVSKRIIAISVQTIINAIIIGGIASILVGLIDYFTNLSFYGKFSFQHSSPEGNQLGIWVVAVPIVGGLIVGVLARYGSKAIRGHGIPEAMDKIILDDSRIPPIITFLKPFSAAISIGTGGPFGAEEPIIATGGALGSLIGQVMHISSAERKILLAAGACAGMSTIFGSPLAAVLLAIELLLFKFSPRSIIPVALACATGAAMHLLLFECRPVFEMPFIPTPTVSALGIYILMGIIIGVVAVLISKSVYAMEDAFAKLPIHWMWWSAIGALAIGITGYFAPYTMGVGYSNIKHLLSGTLPITLLLGLLLLKYFSWVISLGSGTSGGTLAPLFTIGGALGALLGTYILNLFPNSGINISAAALIGMAALFAGSSRALLTSIVFALETTTQMNGLMPLLVACTAAYFVSFFLMKGSIMTEKIQRRGVHTPDEFLPDPFQSIPISELMVGTKLSSLPKNFYVFPDHKLSFAMEMMGKYGLDSIGVVERNTPHTVIGKVDMASAIEYYSQYKQKEYQYHSPHYLQSQRRRIVVYTRRFIQKIAQ